MVRAVIFFVSREVGDAEVGTEVDDLAAGGHQGPGKVRGRTVRQGQEPDVDVLPGGERNGIGVGELELLGRRAAQSRDQLRHGLPRVLA